MRILCPVAVAALCFDSIIFRQLGLARAKGRAKALEIFEVVGETPNPISDEATAEAEIQELKDRRDSADDNLWRKPWFS